MKQPGRVSFVLAVFIGLVFGVGTGLVNEALCVVNRKCGLHSHLSQLRDMVSFDWFHIRDGRFGACLLWTSYT